MCEYHGGRYTQLYSRYTDMKTRCFNPHYKRYADYGGRGVTVCDEWRNSFTRFRDWAVSNGYEDGLSLERIDVNGDYCPENCTWITMAEQAKNKRNSVKVRYHDTLLSLRELAELLGLSYGSIKQRYYRGTLNKILI